MVHGVIGVVALSVRAADPGGFQQLFLLFLLVPLLFLLLSLPLPLSVSEGLLRVSAPDGDVAALSAQAGGALRPSVPLLLPATTFPVSARGTTAKAQTKNKSSQLAEMEVWTISYRVTKRTKLRLYDDTGPISNY